MSSYGEVLRLVAAIITAQAEAPELLSDIWDELEQIPDGPQVAVRELARIANVLVTAMAEQAEEEPATVRAQLLHAEEIGTSTYDEVIDKLKKGRSDGSHEGEADGPMT